MSTAPHEVPIRPVATTRPERRVAKALALEPGARPTRRARIAGLVIKACVRSVWQSAPDTDAGLVRIQRLSDLAGRGQAVPRGVTITPEPLARPSGTEWVRAGSPDESKAFLYLHGGGYFFGSPRLYRPFTWRLSAASRRPVLAVDYRLAPEHTPSDALADAVAAYEFLLERGHRPEDIVVGGDSAGGHLTLALLLTLKEQGKPLPGAAVCLSPWVDLLCEAASHKANRRTEALIPADKLAWLGRSFCEGKEEDDPLFAPHKADLSGLPPMMLIASGSEILRDDVRAVAARAEAAGVQVTYQEWDGLVHVFPIFAPYIPEGKAAFRHIAEFLNRTTTSDEPHTSPRGPSK